MFGFFKNWFKKEEPKEEYYIDYRKLRQRELEQDFNMINNVKYPQVYERIPWRWVEHIDKCVQYEEIEIAIAHLHYWDNFCNWSALFNGSRLDLTPLWDNIKTSKQYKQMKLNEKLERMKADFE